MADEELGEGSVRITLDDSTADADVSRLADRLERALDRASRDAGLRMERNIKAAVRRITPIRLRVEADLRAFEHSLNTLNNLGSAPVRVTPDVDRAQFEAAIEAALAGLEVSVNVVPDLDGFDARIRAHNPPDVNVDVNANVDSDRFSRALSGIGRAVGRLGGLATSAVRIGAIGIAAAGAVQGVVALGAALAPLAGALAAGPAVMLGFVAASNALKLALSGVSDAFKAGLTGDAAAFEKAIKDLSPAAQAAAKEVRALKPQFDALKDTVQDAFFKPLEGQITGVAKALGGPLKTGLSNIAGNFGLAAQRIAEFLQTSIGIQAVTNVLKGTDQATKGLAAAAGPVAAGFLRVAGSVSAAYGPKLQDALANTGARFGNFLGEAAASGQAVAWVQGAVATFKQLGQLLGNIGGILSDVFSQANAVGGGFLNNLIAITDKFREFTSSAAGQEAIGNIFSTLAAVASQLGPIFVSLVSVVGQIAPALAPLFTTIGPAITGLIQALGPALAAIAPGLQALVSGLSDALGQLSDSGALAAVGQAIGAIGTAIAPLLPVIGQLAGALGNILGPAVTAIATALTPVITAIAGALMPIIPPLTDAFTTLVTALTPLVTLIGTTLAQVIDAVAPLLQTLAEIFSQVATALTPLIEQITSALVPIFAQLAPIISTIVAALIPLVEAIISALLPVLPPLIDAFLAILEALTPLLPVVGELVVAVAGLATALIPVIAPIIQFAAEILKWLAINAVVPIIQTVVSVISGIIGVVTNVISAVAGFVTQVVGFFSNFSSNVSSIVSGFVSGVTGFFSSLWSTASSLFSTGISTVVSFVAGLPGRARSAISGLVGAIGGVVSNAWSAAKQAVSTGISNVITLVRGLPGKAKSALAGLAGALVSAGADLIRGFISGIKSMAGSLVSAAKGVVKGAVDGAKSLLGINSPSRVFMEIGKFVGQGFIKGMTGTADQIKRTAEDLAAKVRNAFKGKNTKLDDNLIKSINATSKRLQKLANQRDAIADKIKKANEFAAQTTQSALQSFSLQNLAQKGGGVNGLIDGLDAAVSRIRKFNGQINNLAKRGLRKDLLSQIIGLGPDQGAALADQLNKASDSQLADLNEAQKQLDASAKKLGKDSADNLFDAGKQASKGFLAGLKDQQKDVEDLMLSLAKGMAKAIRKALGIKSPSRVFRAIGRFTMDGLNVGLNDRLRRVIQTSQGAANAITQPFGAAPTLNVGSAPSAASVAAATGGSGAGGRSVTIAPGAVVINQVSDTDDTARRAVNRLVAAGGLL